MLVRVLLLMPLAHLIFFEDSFLSFCVDTIYTDTKLVLFLFYFEVKDNGEVELTRSVFLPKTKFFSRSKPDRTVSRNGKGISDKIEVRLEHLDCLRVNAKSILPHGEIAKSPLASLRPPWDAGSTMRSNPRVSRITDKISL